MELRLGRGEGEDLRFENVSGMYGSIEGIVGNQKALPRVDALSLEGHGCGGGPLESLEVDS